MYFYYSQNSQIMMESAADTPPVVNQKTKLFFDSWKDTLKMCCFHLFEAGLVYILYIITHICNFKVLLHNAGPQQD